MAAICFKFSPLLRRHAVTRGELKILKQIVMSEQIAHHGIHLY